MDFNIPVFCLAALFAAIPLHAAATTSPAAAALQDGDFTIGPVYTAAEETQPVAGFAGGVVHQFTMDSTESAIFPADPSGKPFKRKVWVYVPPDLAAGTASPLMIVQDGGNYHEIITRTLDHLIHEHRLPPIVAVMLNPGPGKQRSVEYDTVSDAYCRFIESEVLPKVQANYSLKFSKDPQDRAAFGTSSGGAAAFTMGWFHPELYHRILTYSGSFTALQTSPAVPHGAWEYFEHLIPNTPPKPLRVALEVGENDLGADLAAESHRNWILSDKGMAAALKAKGYHYRFIFARDARHVDNRVLAQTLPETMLWLWE